MQKTITLMLLWLLVAVAYPQRQPVKQTAKKAVKSVAMEKLPQFPGGEVGLTRYIASNLKYPAMAAENGIQGKVLARFVVLKDGTIGDVEILKSLLPSCDKEVVRLIKNMPKWTPGVQNGQVVSVWLNMPVNFSLDGEAVMVKTPPASKPGTVTDQDGNVYTTVEIGNQTWMVENLRTTTYNDGTKIPCVTQGSVWKSLNTGAYCDYDNVSANGVKYGHLYNSYAIQTEKLCPKGWHVPTYSDWADLINYLMENGYSVSEAKTSIAKSLAATHSWESSNEPGTIGNNLSTNNKSKFCALPGGARGPEGDFMSLNHSGYWWGADIAYPEIGPALHVVNDVTFVRMEEAVKRTCGLSIRCVKDK